MTLIDPSTAAAVVRTAKNLAGKLFGSAGEELSFLIGDNIKIKRLQNQIRNFEKIKKIVEEAGLTLKQVNLKALVPYLENVSLEEDEGLQNLWANLMANYLDSEKNMTSTVYLGVLAQLSTDDITTLNHIEKHDGTDIFSEPKGNFESESIDNLLRLGIIEEKPDFTTTSAPMFYDGGNSDRVRVTQEKSNSYNITSFGWSFMKACKR